MAPYEEKNRGIPFTPQRRHIRTVINFNDSSTIRDFPVPDEFRMLTYGPYT